MRISTFAFLILLGLSVHAQSRWGNMETIYNDGNITVELQFFISKNSCESGGKPFKYKYRVNGNIAVDEKYLVWKMDYITCKGESFFEQISLPIGGSEALQNFGPGVLKDKVFYDELVSAFICDTLVKPFYEVKVSPVRKTGIGKKTVYQPKDTTVGWGPIKGIFNDSTLQVELQFYYSKNSCEDGGKPFKYRYRLNGFINPDVEKFLTWKMDYMNCNSELVYEQMSLAIGGLEALQNFGSGQIMDLYFYDPLNFKFICFDLVEPFHDVVISGVKKTGLGKPLNFFSNDPMEIEGEKNIYIGQSTLLKVKDGSLGTGARWVWYKNACGLDSIGTGPFISVSPTDTTYYYVRAEGANNITQCAKIKVNVDMRSVSPSRITGNNKVCKGTASQLMVTGGSLGLDAEWVWYANDCNGRSIGHGNTISVKPNESTTYFVRAEGKLNKTACAKYVVNVFANSSIPDSIVSNNKKLLCEGEKIRLKTAGGQLANDAVWKWNTGTCDGAYVGTDSILDVKPAKTTTYFVHAEGLCNSTECISITVSVITKSVSPAYVSAEVLKYRKAILTVNGGSLGKDAQWQWYKGSCDKHKPIGTGQTIKIKTHKSTKYFVKAKGLCNETTCSEILITPIKRRSLDYTYASKYEKLVSLGIGAGIEWSQFSELGKYTSTFGGISTNHDSSKISFNGAGVKGEIIFYPYIKDYVSLGFIVAGAMTFKDKEPKEINTVEHYSYQRFQAESELAAGFKPIKAIIKLKRSSQTNNYSKVHTLLGNTDEYSYKGTMNNEILSLGIRFGRYERKTKYKRGHNLDLLYTLRRNPSDIFAFSLKDYKNASAWKVGSGISYWRQNAVKLQVDAYFNTVGKNFKISRIDGGNIQYQASILLNLNLFY